MGASDGDDDTLYYSLTGGTHRLMFTIASTTGQIKTASSLSLDYEDQSSYDVTVGVSDKKDANGNADTDVDGFIGVFISVTDVAEPPSKPGAPKVKQNSTTPKTKLDVSWSAPAVPSGQPPLTGYDVQYRDSNAATTTWSSWSFSGTGTSTAIHSLTASTTYEVQVRAKNHEGSSGWTNSGSATTQQPNLNPAFPSATTSRSVAENTAVGGSVGAAVAATDAEGDTLTYTLGGTDATKFGIGLNTGQITVRTGFMLDYESKTSYSVTVSVSDRKNISAHPDTAIDDTITVTINVTDVAEPPAAPNLTVAPDAITPTTKISVSWTAPNMVRKPALSGYDLDYRLAGDSSWTSSALTATTTSVTLTGLTASKTYDVRLRANNAEGSSPWASASTVTKGGAVTRSIQENSPAGTNVGAPVTVTATTSYDLTHALSGTDASSFSIASDTGQITVGHGNDAGLRHQVVVQRRRDRDRSRRGGKRAEPRPQRAGRLHHPGDHQPDRREREADLRRRRRLPAAA